ncbi:hypothetical protein [Burkholderia phage FLC8]|nr:hypothetical protein [Burkholderia phage FLC8]
MVDMNSLDAVKKMLKKELTEFSGKPFRRFKSEQEVKDVFFDLLAKALKLGLYSYDPTIGEIAWYIGKEHEIDLFSRLDGSDDRFIANIVREVLDVDGWTNVIILPPVTGSNRILIKMRHDDIRSGVVIGAIAPAPVKVVKKK